MGFSKIIRDLTERREYERHLRQSEERFRLLIESVIDYAIVTIGADGYITSWNSGAQRITGFSATEIVGRHFSRLYPPEDVAEHKPWRHLIGARDQAAYSKKAGGCARTAPSSGRTVSSRACPRWKRRRSSSTS
jgi:PAS domain-containing protein